MATLKATSEMGDSNNLAEVAMDSQNERGQTRSSREDLPRVHNAAMTLELSATAKLDKARDLSSQVAFAKSSEGVRKDKYSI